MHFKISPGETNHCNFLHHYKLNPRRDQKCLYHEMCSGEYSESGTSKHKVLSSFAGGISMDLNTNERIVNPYAGAKVESFL